MTNLNLVFSYFIALWVLAHKANKRVGGGVWAGGVTEVQFFVATVVPSTLSPELKMEMPYVMQDMTGVTQTTLVSPTGVVLPVLYTNPTVPPSVNHNAFSYPQPMQ